VASNYPGGLDSFDTIASDKKMSDAVGGRTHRAILNDMGDAIEAVQTELGTDPAGGSATVKARFEVIEANDWVTADKIAANAVGSSELADNAVDTAAIATGAVTAEKILIGTATVGYGTASPEGSVTAPIGSSYLQTSGAVTVSGQLLWRKTSGTGSTGWTPEGALADTGWRKIVSWTGGVQDGANQIGTVDTTQYSMTDTGSIYIRRIGQYIDWWIHGQMNKINTSGHKLFTVDNLIPSGFRADGSATYGVSAPLNNLVDFLGTYSIGDTPAFDAASANALMYYATCRHYTSNPWPTSLPGVAGT